jgi:glycosyltransferase involved in cell wall biosynthesis
LRGDFLGEGPDRPALEEAIHKCGMDGVVTAPGFLSTDELEARMRRALCLLVTSRREGYGMVVVEAASWGTPSVVVAGEDNAATELIEEGVNGFVAQHTDPEAISEAIVRVNEAGAALRASTARWFAENAERLSVEHSLDTVLAIYTDRSARA